LAKAEPQKEEIKYIIRIAQTDLDGKKDVQYALTGLKGIGIRTARILTESAEVDPTLTMGYLKDDQIERLRVAVDNFQANVPTWMFNHQKDVTTGQNIHILGSELTLTLREDINRMKKTRSYIGIRHERGHKVRGQKTKSTGRRGATVGVQRKKKQ
jgi:small subunit ribosomal protein S13